ncbi:MAG: hypothetical protein AAF557_23405 [Pseudomonadota bacterium]
MRTLLLGASAAIVFTMPSVSAETFLGIEGLTTQSNLSAQTRIYYWNQAGASDNGFQIVTPFTISTSISNELILLELDARAAYIIAQTSRPGADGGVLSPSDTVVSATATFSHPELPVFPFVTASLNLPTGKETLRGIEKNAVVDSDLVEQTRFGEGFNVNVGAGVTVPITKNITATLGGSYNLRGDYVPDGDRGEVFDPGEQFVLYSEVQYQDPGMLASLGFKFNYETESTLDDVPFFRPGDSFELYGQFGMSVTGEDIVNLSFSAARFTKNERFDPFTGTFRVEDERSAGDVYRVDASWRHRTSFGTVGVAGQYLRRERNDFDETSDLFLPARQRYLFGPTASVKVGDKTQLDFRAQYMRLVEDVFPVTGLQRTFNGFIVTGGLNIIL